MHAALFAQGDCIDSPLVRTALSQCGYIVAVDGGARHCQSLNITPHAVIGDMDSIDPGLLQQYATKNIEIIRYPKEKNEIDLTLALTHARDRGATDITVLGSFGNRWDFTLANLLLLAHPVLRTLPMRFLHDMTEVILIRAGTPYRLAGNPGDTVSLVPLAEDAQGVTLEGFRYPLKNETLAMGQTRGLSNELTQSQGSITLTRGMLLCFHAHQRPPTAGSA